MPINSDLDQFNMIQYNYDSIGIQSSQTDIYVTKGEKALDLLSGLYLNVMKLSSDSETEISVTEVFERLTCALPFVRVGLL